MWSRDGGTLYFRTSTHLMAASITERPELAVTRRDSLFAANIAGDGVGYAVLPDGQRFIATLGPPRREGPYRIAVISNWQSLFVVSSALGSQP